MNDKYQHALVCYSLMLTGEILIGAWAGLLMALGFAIGKEWIDSRTPGNVWDWNDIYADLAGIVIALAVYR